MGQSNGRKLIFGFFLVFLVAYNLFRVGLYFMAVNGAIHSDKPLAAWVNDGIVYSELVIGLVGLIAITGLVLSKSWGFWATIGISAYAIVFDGWSGVTVQASAFGGVVPPAIILATVAAYRQRFLHPLRLLMRK